MRSESPLARPNAAFLEQALELLDSLPAELYAARPVHFDRGGVGAHLRHVLDHYDAFLDGLERGRIDYDARERDPATERDLDVARARLSRTLERLSRAASRPDFAQPELPLEVATEQGGACVSSLGRELQYLVAHTVHHFALIAVALRLSGHEPGADFGVAPATLRHALRSGAGESSAARSSGACAR